MAQFIKNRPAMQENWVQSLGWHDPTEKEMETHSTYLSWKIHGQRNLWATVHAVARVGEDLTTKPPPP